MRTFSARQTLLSLGDSQLMDPFLGQIVVATLECDLRGEDYLSSFPLFAPIWIVGSTSLRPADCLRG